MTPWNKPRPIMQQDLFHYDGLLCSIGVARTAAYDVVRTMSRVAIVQVPRCQALPRVGSRKTPNQFDRGMHGVYSPLA